MSQSDQPLRAIDAHGRHAQSVCFTADSRLLISAGMDRVVRFWRVPDFEEAGELRGHEKSVNTLSLSPSEDSLVTGSSDGTVRVWSLHRRTSAGSPHGETLQVLPQQSGGVFSPDGRLLATISQGKRVVLWEVATWEVLQELPVLDARVFSVTFTPDSQSLLVGGSGDIFHLGLPGGEALNTLTGHQVAVPSVAFAPGGDVLASAGADGGLRFWSPASWLELRRINLGAPGIYRLAFTPAGDRIAVSADHLIQVYSVPGGELERRIEVRVKGVYGVAISPDGRYLANAAADGKVRIWALEGGLL